MKGMSAKVSIAFSHRDFPLAISQAIGIPARRSKAATANAIIKLFSMAPKARLASVGLFKMNWILSHLIKMPARGGTSISAKKMIIADA